MPRKFPRRPARRRRHRARRSRRTRKSSIFNPISTKFIKSIDQLFPDRLVTRLRNNSSIGFTSAAGATWGWGFLGNGLHVPLSAGYTGANPLAFSVATAVVGLGAILGTGGVNSATPYNSYRILSSQVILKVQNTNTSAGTSGELNLFPSTDYNALGNVNTWQISVQAEYPYNKKVHIGGTTMNRGVTLRNSCSTAKMYGLKYKSSLEDPAYDGYYGANPTNGWGWIISWFPDTTSNSPIFINVDIIYTIEFFDRNLMTTGSGG
jgi:hypothetical protein